MCDKCIPCQSLLNRMPPEAGICARTEDDCGVCLDGLLLTFSILLILSLNAIFKTIFLCRFQSEDLTAQRRSYKCFRKVDDGSKETLEANDLYNLASILTVTISSLLLMSVIVAVIIYLVKCMLITDCWNFWGTWMRWSFIYAGQPSLKKVNDESRHGREKVAVVDALPPPYNQLDIAVSDVSLNSTWRLCLVETAVIDNNLLEIIIKGADVAAEFHSRRNGWRSIKSGDSDLSPLLRSSGWDPWGWRWSGHSAR